MTFEEIQGLEDGKTIIAVTPLGRLRWITFEKRGLIECVKGKESEWRYACLDGIYRLSQLRRLTREDYDKALAQENERHEKMVARIVEMFERR